MNSPAEASVASSEHRGESVRFHYLIGLLLLVAAGFHLVVFAIDGGPWEGPVSWRKAITFGLSFGISVLTITWISGFVPLGGGARRLLLGTFSAASALEVGLTSMQAWRRVPSHFNLESTFDSVASRLLAVGGVSLIAVVVALTVTSFRNSSAIPASMRSAVRSGLVALLVSMAFGAVMIARGIGLESAGFQQAAYDLGGFLRPAHAVTMHAVLLLPALAWLLGRSSRTEESRLLLIRIATGTYAATAALVVIASAMGATILTPATAAAVSAAAVVGPSLVILALGGLRKPVVRR